MVHHFTDSHHSSSSSSSPSKDQTSKTRRLANGTFLRKTIIMLVLLAAVVFILMYKPPTLSVTSNTLSGSNGGSRTTKTNREPIQMIAILGERNSGTRWTFEYVCKSVFPSFIKAAIKLRVSDCHDWAFSNYIPQTQPSS
jgi:hypothetical protein